MRDKNRELEKKIASYQQMINEAQRVLENEQSTLDEVKNSDMKIRMLLEEMKKLLTKSIL